MARSKESEKEYRDNNKEKIALKKKKWCVKNKAKIAEYKKEKVTCEACNLEVCRGHLSKHNKTQRHMENLKKMFLKIVEPYDSMLKK